MLTLSICNSRHVPMGPITEVTLALGTRRRPWFRFGVKRLPDRRGPADVPDHQHESGGER